MAKKKTSNKTAKKAAPKKAAKKQAVKKSIANKPMNESTAAKKTKSTSAAPSISFNPPTKYPMKDLGAAMTGPCDLKQPGCTANPAGQIRAYRNKTLNRQVNACRHCHDQMVLTGQWVDLP